MGQLSLLMARAKYLIVYQVCIVGYDIDKLRPDFIVSDCIWFIMGSDPGYIGYQESMNKDTVL